MCGDDAKTLCAVHNQLIPLALIWLADPETSLNCHECHRQNCGNDRTKVQRGERTFDFIINGTNKTRTTPLTMAIQATNKDNYPQNTKGKKAA
jgi:hypothetical protein